MNKKSFGFTTIILGVLAGVLFISAGGSIAEAGKTMTEIQSQAGNTVAEAYYQSVGVVAKGFSLFTYAMGLSVISLSVGIGGKLLLTPENSTSKEVLDLITSNQHEKSFDDLPEL